MNISAIARICHETNRVLTEYAEDVPMQPSWESISEDMRRSCETGVQFALDYPDATPEQQHEAWCAERRAQGWVFGQVKNIEAKTHPALKPYAELSPETRLKDAVFRAIVCACRKEL
jgi:hypothetical protein